jgi:hypothetical protein
MWLRDETGRLTQAQRDALSNDVLGLGTLQEVVRWSFSARPPRDVAAVHVQDEFSHDVVLPWVDGLVLAFDTT